MQWYDWIAVIASVATLVGLPLTFWRVLRTSQAVAETERRLTRQQLLTLLSSLRTAELGLDAATVAGDRNGAVAQVLAFKTTANRVQGLIGDDPAYGLFIGELRQVATAALQIKTDLVDLKAPTAGLLKAKTKSLRTAFGAVADAAETLETQLATSTRMGGKKPT